jgi:hypothetical protein
LPRVGSSRGCGVPPRELRLEDSQGPVYGAGSPVGSSQGPDHRRGQGAGKRRRPDGLGQRHTCYGQQQGER